MHVAKVVSRQRGREYVSWLLRQSVRDGPRVRHRTLANLSMLPPPAIDALRAVLRGEPVQVGTPGWEKVRSLPHGAVEAVLAMLQRLGLPALLDPRPSRARTLVTALIAARLLHPASKLGTTRLWHTSTLATELGVEDADEDELYAALDWLRARQPRIEQRLARRALTPGGLVLVDLSSSYLEGRHCQLARIGYSRDGKRGTLQIEYALLCAADGEPVAVEVFAGNVGDPTALAAQVTKLRDQFGVRECVLVGDRGMLTQARIHERRTLEGITWISALRAPQIQALVESGALQLSLFDERNLAEITSPTYPGERLVVCQNPLLAEERRRKREDLLRATEALLAPIQARVATGRLRGQDQVGLAVGRVLDRHKVGKHFHLTLTDDRCTVTRDSAGIAAEAALDGVYVLRTSVASDRLPTPDVVRAYKRLAKVERVFRALKAHDLQVRPIRHWTDDRVRAHVFLCLLGCWLRWHLERVWAPLLFTDEAPPVAPDPVAPAQRSPAARAKAPQRRLPDGTVLHSFATLLAALTTRPRDWIRATPVPEAPLFTLDTTPTPLQARALELVRTAPL